MAFIDILILVFFGIFFLMGTANGALRSLLSFFGIAFSLVLTLLLSSNFTAFFCDKIFDLQAYFSEEITNYILERYEGAAVQIPSTVQELSLAFTLIGLPSFLSDLIAQPLFPLLPSYEGSFAAFLGENLSHITSLFLCGVLLYILIRTAFHIVIVYTDRLFKSHSVGLFSRFIGGALGITKAYLYLLIAFSLLSVFPSFPLFQSFQAQIETSTTVAKWIFQRNFIAELLIQKIDFPSAASALTMTETQNSHKTELSGNSFTLHIPNLSRSELSLFAEPRLPAFHATTSLVAFPAWLSPSFASFESIESFLLRSG